MTVARPRGKWAFYDATLCALDGDFRRAAEVAMLIDQRWRGARIYIPRTTAPPEGAAAALALDLGAAMDAAGVADVDGALKETLLQVQGRHICIPNAVKWAASHPAKPLAFQFGPNRPPQ